MEALPDVDHSGLPEGWGYDLLLYGNEQIIRGSDTGTLVALGAIAFQQIRGKGQPHQHVGCGLLLFSVVLCAIVHFAVGSASVGRARSIIRSAKETRGARLFRRTNQLVAWTSAAIQFLFILVGATLVLKETPPAFLQKYLISLFN
jgi:hypothetical protein